MAKFVDVHYAEEHRACPCYTDNNPHPMVETIELLPGQSHRRTGNLFETIFVMSGEITLSRKGRPDQTIARKRLFLLSPGIDATFHGLKPTHIMACRLNGLNYCNKLKLAELKEYTLPQTTDLCTLTFKAPMTSFANTLAACVENGLRCEVYLNAKFTELMFLLRGYYTKQELAGFFRPVLGGDAEFCARALDAAAKANSVRDMAERLYMSIDWFRERFRKEFGMSPKKFLLERKTLLILNDLRKGKTNRQICGEYDFPSPSALTNFCRKHFGQTPTELRKTGGASEKSAEQDTSPGFVN